ncbi:anthranilate phosphoribosyltransferase [Altererythrobacter sp. MF3-039]|uniref:anthranilate phosphoribosyltransferase n=1 Tax=Altererythrobacter sp. MF3-039 TaxID=3252901 RepID=UPI00390C8AD1
MTLEETEELFGRMLDGELDDEAIAATLVEMADRGETAREVAGAVRAMRKRMVALDGLEHAIDVCGTGGDGQHTLNVSTAVAIVVAACGVPVAKHGNRAASSKAGAADTLEALGLNLANASKMAPETLPDHGIAFFFAQAHHPALGRIAPIRKALGRRTIFNLLGPLANPARVTRQLVGVPSPDLVPLYREAMELLGMEQAMIVSGEEGLDEISISGPTRIATIGLVLEGNCVTPEQAGLPRHPLEDLRGGDAEYNAAALRRMLQGEEGAYRDAVLLNSAGALIVAGEVSDWREGAEEAAEAIDKGLANALLDCWIGTVK